jgi:glutathione S-transferase
MKLFNSVGPNPRVVTMAIAEKGIDIEVVEVDIMSAENRQEEYLKLNPGGQCPALEMEDGNILAEITVICDYLDEKFAGPSLMGETAEQRALTRMWCRRLDLNITEFMAMGFRWGVGIDMFKDRMRCLPEASEGMNALAQDGLAWLDPLLSGEFIAGDRFSLADIQLFCFIDFFAAMGQTVNPDLKNVHRWLATVSQRPSVAASVHPSMAG